MQQALPGSACGNPFNEDYRPNSSSSSRSISAITEKVLDDNRLQLQREVEELKKYAADLKRRIPDPECEKMCRLWGGSEITNSTETEFSIDFLVHFKKVRGEKFSISLQKLGQFWSLSHHSLPCSIKNIRARIEREYIDNISKLSSFIRRLQLEVKLFVLRREQFKDAMSLVSPSLTIHPSANTLLVTLWFRIHDYASSDLCKVYVRLNYKAHKYLPEEPLFTFTGGDKEAHKAFKDQLTYLESMPLKEALLDAFPQLSKDCDTTCLPMDISVLDSDAIHLSEPAEIKAEISAKELTPPPVIRRQSLRSMKKLVTDPKESQTEKQIEIEAPLLPAAPAATSCDKRRGRGGSRGNRAIRGGRGRK